MAMVRLGWEAPGLLLAEHLEGQQAILIFRVAKLETAVPEIYAPRGRSAVASRCHTKWALS